MKLSILTPTYNRQYTLPKLYNSLLNQTCKDFEWVIVDDGSLDDTKKLVNSYIKQNKIRIRYFYKENGGKHRALNYGMQYIDSTLTFIVDSDDWLIPSAVQEIISIYDKYKNNSNIACYSFHRMYPDGRISGPNYKNNEFVDNYINYRINNHIMGEGSEVVLTSKMKEIPFLEIPNEKFLSEGYFWMKLALKYDTVYIDKPIYVFNYLDDGLTKNLLKLRKNNPIGVVEVQKLYFNSKVGIIPKIKSMIKYIAYGKLAKYKVSDLYKNINCKMLFIFSFLLGNIYYIKNCR